MTFVKEQPALPGLATAAADAARAASHLRGSWTAAEVAFANACIDAWNEAFAAHGVRANRTKHNLYLAVHALKWINGPLNDGERMTPQDVLVAIKAYAADPYNRDKLGGRYLAFPDWMKDAIDKHVDKQLARIGQRRGHTAKTSEETQQQRNLAIARQMLEDSGWSTLITESLNARTSDGNPASLPEYLRIRRAQYVRMMDQRRGTATAAPLKLEVNDIDARLKALEAYKSLDDATRRPIFARAEKALAPAKDGRQKVGMTLALAVELHRRYGTRGPAQNAKVSA